MKRVDQIILACLLVISVALLSLVHFGGDPSWITLTLPGEDGSAGILWQVQTTFLSVGFAGLAIAAQLFVDAPLAIGASRGRVLEHVRAGWFVGVGLVANTVIAIETIWLPSDLGLIGVAIFWFLPTVVLLVVSTTKLMQLFGHPSRLDEVVRTSLVESLAARLDEVARKYAGAKRKLEGLSVAEDTLTLAKTPIFTLRVPVPESGRVIKMIRPQTVQRAIDALGLLATEEGPSISLTVGLVEPPRIRIDVEPGDRTRLGETAFRVVTSKQLDEATAHRTVRQLQSSIEFEPSGSVTPDEETDREIANLKDAIGTGVRSGAFASAERALEFLGHVVRGAWMTEPAILDASRRASRTRRNWLFRSIGEVEQDALHSPRAAGMFVEAAMTRALEAPRTGSPEFVNECLRSFTRIWIDVLKHGGAEFSAVPSRVLTCVQNLSAYSWSISPDRIDLQARGTWAMVEMVKLALDAKRPDSAISAARELNGLFEFERREGTGRAHVRGGQLVLSGWLDYLAETNDDRAPEDPRLRQLVSPRGTWSEILDARRLAERGVAPFGRWEWWEVDAQPSGRAQVMQLSGYVDAAELEALTSSYGSLPPAVDQETASDYKRFMRLIGEADSELATRAASLTARLNEEIANWDAAEDQRLAREPVSEARIEELRLALTSTLDEGPQLAGQIPTAEEVSEAADASFPILGMNFRVPRHYLVNEMFNQTLADPKDLGRIIARGFSDGEERKIIKELRSAQSEVLPPTASAILRQIEILGDDAEHHVLVTPYGGMDDFEVWYSAEFREAVGRLTHIEAGALDTEALLFDRRTSLKAYREPEEKEGLAPVAGTSIALGVFEDVVDSEEPHVRVETGEHFVVWHGENPRVTRFGSPPADDGPSPERGGSESDA